MDAVIYKLKEGIKIVVFPTDYHLNITLLTIEMFSQEGVIATLEQALDEMHEELGSSDFMVWNEGYLLSSKELKDFFEDCQPQHMLKKQNQLAKLLAEDDENWYDSDTYYLCVAEKYTPDEDGNILTADDTIPKLMELLNE